MIHLAVIVRIEMESSSASCYSGRIAPRRNFSGIIGVGGRATGNSFGKCGLDPQFDLLFVYEWLV